MMEERDTRGWILTLCSALACCAGASVIFIDLLPWKRFSIRSNSSFLAACLSLSFSVLSFSGARLFGEAVTYLDRVKHHNTYIVVTASFSAGFLVCYYLFKFLHRFIPHRTVNCDDDSKPVENGYRSGDSSATLLDRREDAAGRSKVPDEETALLSNGKVTDLTRRPTFAKRLTNTVAKMTRSCTEDGRCLGFITCPCEGKCMRQIGGQHRTLHACEPGHCGSAYSADHGATLHDHDDGVIPILESEEHDEDDGLRHHHHDHSHGGHNQDDDHHHNPHAHGDAPHHHEHDNEAGYEPHKHSHHHHIAKNAFIGIGFQTSLAIALHRCPDGFITFITNHADKQLGFTIFLSLFIHSAVDGFTMCLPLYLALNSAWKAVSITFVVGGLAQPLGGLVAYLWLKVGTAPSETAYGIIFSFTAGLMSVVAVQLLRQIPSDHNHPDLPYISMLAGIVLMCLSIALTSS